MNTQKNKNDIKISHIYMSDELVSEQNQESTHSNSDKSFDYWLKKNKYYHDQIIKFYQFVVPQGSTVLQINCANGYLLNALKPSWGVGIDIDQSCIEQARQQYPDYTFFWGDFETLPQQEPFDYIILSLATMHTYDIQDLLISLRRFCKPSTRILLDHYSYLWEPVLDVTRKLRLRRPTKLKNWVSGADLHTFLTLSGYEVVTEGRYMMIPTYIPLIATFFNKIAIHIPLLNKLCLQHWIIARPAPVTIKPENVTVSVIVPCRNEKGNVERAVMSTPIMGKETEIIFVEGNSSDGTFDEIKRVIEAYPSRKIRGFVQEGKGKGDAVRIGFAHARGDILMILDGDLTMPPEELPKFFEAMVSGKGEFINGSRLVYGMESGAMRFLNLLANFFFSVLFSWLLNQKVKDTLCGTKVLWAHDYNKIVKGRHFFGNFDPFGDFDLLFGAAKLNLKIVDMPIHYKSRTYGTTQIRRFYHGWILLGMSLLALKKLKFR